MSRLGKKPIQIPQGTTVQKTAPSVLEVKGKQGVLTVKIPPFVACEVSDAIRLSAEATHAQARANWGTASAHVKNALLGVTEGFTKILEIEGIGYRASLDQGKLVLMLGFTHPVLFPVPEGITIVIEKSIMKVSGVDKALVGETAARIRKLRKPEPYKGKGIRYRGEVIRKKVGKKIAGAGAEKSG